MNTITYRVTIQRCDGYTESFDPEPLAAAHARVCGLVEAFSRLRWLVEKDRWLPLWQTWSRAGGYSLFWLERVT